MKPGDASIAERRELADPMTGRKIIQLTFGPWDDYPLYYFIPTVTKDGGSLIFHRLRDDVVQYHRLDIETGRVVCLTGVRTSDALWRPWMLGPKSGVRENMGALNQVTNELIYFDGLDIRAVHIHTLADRLVARVPEGRVPFGQTGVSPDGRHFVYPHSDRAWWEATGATAPERHTARGCKIEVVALSSGESRAVLTINAWITHAGFYDNERILMSHPPTEQGILMTDLAGDTYVSVRTQSSEGKQTCHYQATRRGIMYEFNSYALPIRRDRGVMGVYDPDTRKRRDYRIKARITHIGFDPEGRLWFAEQIQETPRFGRLIGYCPELKIGANNEFVPLTEPVITYGDQHLQRAHVHPSLMPDRRHILFTRGDERTQRNYLCLLDVSDIGDTAVNDEV